MSKARKLFTTGVALTLSLGIGTFAGASTAQAALLNDMTNIHVKTDADLRLQADVNQEAKHSVKLGTNAEINQELEANVMVWSEQGGWVMIDGKPVWSNEGGYIWMDKNTSSNLDVNVEANADMKSSVGIWVWSESGGWIMTDKKAIWSENGGYIWVKGEASADAEANLEVGSESKTSLKLDWLDRLLGPLFW